MTQDRLLQLAYNGAILLWGSEYDKLQKDPDNTITQHRERERWEELQEVTDLLKAAEQQKSPC